MSRCLSSVRYWKIDKSLLHYAWRLKGFEYGRTGFGEEERRKKKGEKKNFDQPKEDKKKSPQVKQTGLDHK